MSLLALKNVLTRTLRAPCRICVSLMVSSISEMMEIPVGSIRFTIPVLIGKEGADVGADAGADAVGEVGC